MPTTENPKIERRKSKDQKNRGEPGNHPPEKEQPFDPFLYRAEMPFSAVYFPMGFPVRLTTNSIDVLAAAQESWGVFRQQFDTPPIRLQVGVLDDGSTELPMDFVSRGLGHLMVQISDSRNFFVADLLRDFSFGWFSATTVSHSNYFRHQSLEAMALFHIANRHTTPIHAACVARNGHGVMLCGNSGAGKSSLAFACARAGWTYTTDDACYLVHRGKDRQVLGNCHILRLRPIAAGLFEEIKGRPITPRAKGKPSIELLTASLPGMITAAEARINSVVFLNRRDANVQELLPFPVESARRYIGRHLSGEEALRGEQIASMEKLLTAEIFELHYHDMDWAIDRLERLVRGER